MKKRNSYGYCRNPKTTQEKRLSLAHKEYVRAKRRFRNLPDAYDDIQVTWPAKSWKEKRETQYRNRPRGKEHVLGFPAKRWPYWIDIWQLERLLIKLDIAYRVEHKYERYYYYQTRKTCWTGRYVEKRLVYTDLRFWVKENVEVELDKPIRHSYNKLVGHELVWWSDKDIGIEHIMRKCLYY